MKKIILGGGCFWGVEAYYSRLKGVIKCKVGYANGITDDTNYQEVCLGATGHVEICEIVYDENIIHLTELLEHLFKIIDPTSLNRQGEDSGTQYRTGIYYENEEDRLDALNFINNKGKSYNKPIVVEVERICNFCEAEEYHQKYLDKNPSGYCHINLNLIMENEKNSTK